MSNRTVVVLKLKVSIAQVEIHISHQALVLLVSLLFTLFVEQIDLSLSQGEIGQRELVTLVAILTHTGGSLFLNVSDFNLGLGLVIGSLHRENVTPGDVLIEQSISQFVCYLSGDSH